MHTGCLSALRLSRTCCFITSAQAVPTEGCPANAHGELCGKRSGESTGSPNLGLAGLFFLDSGP